jgi:hypothetical protein
MEINFDKVKKGRFMSKDEDISLLKIQENEKFLTMIDKLTHADKRNGSQQRTSSDEKSDNRF